MYQSIKKGVWIGLFSFIIGLWSVYAVNISGIAKVSGNGITNNAAVLMTNPTLLILKDSSGIAFWSIILVLLVLTPITEELIFRFVPIKTCQFFVPETPQILWPILLSSSVLFGASHGGWPHVFIQGLSGIIYASLMLGTGFWASCIAHATCNTLVTSLFLAIYYFR